MRRHFIWALLSLTILPLGCDRGDDPAQRTEASSGWAQYDSAGVEISVTPGHLARAPLSWAVDSLANPIIGDDETPAEILFGVRGVKALSGERLVVLDGGSREVRFFGRDERPLGSIGRRGEGPGEFEDPRLVPAFAPAFGDSLLIFDAGVRRFHLVSPGDRGFRVFRPEGWPTGRPPVGVIGSHVLVDSAFHSGGEMGVIRTPVTYMWVDIRSGRRTPVRSFLVARTIREENPPYAPSAWPIPFTQRPPVVVSETGALLVPGRAPEIHEYDVNGVLRTVFRIDQPPRLVTRAVLEAEIDYRDAQSARARSDWERIYSEYRVPDTLPAFSSLVVDDLGWLWAEVYEMDRNAQRTWMIFDAAGRAHGTVSTPSGLQVRAIGEDYLIGVWMDETGVEQVRRYSIDGRGG